ncbi:MAG: PKD domain-containing protein, partial [Bacteroidota bacterium]
MRYTTLFFFFILLKTVPLSASHIIGGEVTYECLGNGRYLVDFHIYRDCQPGNADFDRTGVLTYFVCDEDGNCDGQSQSDGRILRVAPRIIRPVDPPDLECLVAPVDICVEEAIYTFEVDGNRATFNPLPSNTYVLVFQRCCRNETILNIESPGTSGSSYIAKISPISQSTCNSSPVFNDFPPTIICNNEPINFDHSATDPDGDSLVYSFCTPLLGGGLAGDADLDPLGNALACDGAGPEPACPNFDNPVSFIEPTYTAQRPMAGNPVVQIDSETGLITGIPTVQGQFVVGVCVSEYRNGELLGTIQRDFQFNVAACIQEITAQIASDEVIENIGPNGQIVSRDFALTVCGQESVEFVNESFDRAFIDNIRWEFDGGTILSDDWNATVAFPGQGTYAGKLVLNPDSPQCIDSANIFVEILPDLTADFAATFDSCAISPVQFTDNSVAEASTITSWQWTFDDGATSSQTSPTHQYDNSGSYRVQLTIEDDNGCTSEYVETINYAPAPQAVDIDQSATTGCDPAPVVFINNSSPLDDSYRVLW